MIELFEEMQKNIKVEDSDYVKDDILHCGKCKTPKQTNVKILNHDYIMPIACKCQLAEMQEYTQRKKEQAKEKVLNERKKGMTENRYKLMTFDTSTSNLDFAINYVDNFEDMQKENIGLLLYGGVGTGKTFASACIGNELIKQGKSVLMINSTKLAIALTDFDTRDEMLHKIKTVDLFILDDFGAEHTNEFTQEKIYLAVETRYTSNKPIIVTTNLTKNEFTSTDVRFTRTYDRIKECCYPICLKGESKRIEQANNKFEEYKEILSVKPSYDLEKFKEKAKNVKYERK